MTNCAEYVLDQCITNINIRTGDLVEAVRALAALWEHLHSTHTVVHTISVTAVLGNLMPFCPPQAIDTHVEHMHTCK